MSDETISASDLAEMAESEPGAEPVGGPGPESESGGGAEFGDPDPESGSSLVDMLLSTDPDLSPREARGVFDMSVSPADHLEVGIAKMTNSGGTPAVLHLGMAAVLAVGGGDVLDGGESESGESESEAPDPVSGGMDLE